MDATLPTVAGGRLRREVSHQGTGTGVSTMARLCLADERAQSAPRYAGGMRTFATLLAALVLVSCGPQKRKPMQLEDGVTVRALNLKRGERLVFPKRGAEMTVVKEVDFQRSVFSIWTGHGAQPRTFRFTEVESWEGDE